MKQTYYKKGHAVCADRYVGHMQARPWTRVDKLVPCFRKAVGIPNEPGARLCVRAHQRAREGMRMDESRETGFATSRFFPTRYSIFVRWLCRRGEQVSVRMAVLLKLRTRDRSE